MDNLFIFLDESGDLGFDWDKSGTTEHFVITLLVCESLQTVKLIKNAIKRTIKNKINSKKNKPTVLPELKGGEKLEINQYFYTQLPTVGWSLYSIILTKRRVNTFLQSKTGKHKLYNFLAKTLIDRVPMPPTIKTVSIVLDKCKKAADVEDCNQYLCDQIRSRLPSIKVILNVTHEKSHENPALQAVDIFCWGISRKYHRKDEIWYNCFKEKIEEEIVYLPQ